LYSRHNGRDKSVGSDDDEQLASLIERWFDGARNRLAALSAFVDEGDAWHGEQRRNGRSHHRPSQDEIAASWRRTQVLLEAHLLNHDEGAFGGGEGHAFSTVLGGSGNAQSVFLGERLSRVSGHHLRRLEGLEEGLKTLYS
jgi:hypothetical protein